MKTYSIGRDVNCDIVINDSTDVISRRHALLNVTSSGKMTIIDQSSNGTYVNGIRISPNVPVPVTRKDTISLAHVTKLDWTMVPKSTANIRYALFFFAGLIIVVGVVFGIRTITDNKNYNNETNQIPLVDSVALKKAEQARLDSLAKIARVDSLRQDSIKKAAKERQDSLERAKKMKREKKIQNDKGSKVKKEKPAKSPASKQDIG